jgi:hypothetical protein
MPVPGGEITTSEILVPVAEQNELVTKVSTLIMSGGYSDEVALEIIKLVLGWDEDDLPELS